MRAGMGVLVMAMLVAMPLAAQQRPRPAPPATDQIAAPGRPGWTVDATNGCWVWNANPHAGEIVRWQGGCPRGPAEGQGRGEWRWTENGAAQVSTQIGSLRNGRLEGHGVVTWPTGSRYEGEWRDGRQHGRGVFTGADGSRHEGEYRDGRRNGHGVSTSSNGTRHEGEYRDGLQDGRGVETFASGSRYEGDYRAGRYHGRGVMTYADGNRYDGEYRDNRPDGFGTYTTSNGTYAGTWAGGCFRDRQGNRAAIGRPLAECP